MTAASPAGLPDGDRAPLLPPQARLEASRVAMRIAMAPDAPAPKGATRASPGKSFLSSPVNSLLAHPVVSTLRDTAEQWWLTHPWRPVVIVGVEAASQMLVPLARRHPGRLIVVAMLGGAVLSRWRPWKWILATTVPALAASMLPTLISRVATRIPLSTLLRVVGSSPARTNRARSERALPPATSR